VRNITRVRRTNRENIVAIDGEGQGSYPHIYNYIAASNEKGKQWQLENRKGLTTKQCLDFILSLPNDALVFGYALQYDITKWLADLPNKLLYDLMHEKERQFLHEGKVRYRPVKWEGYSLNFINRKLTIQKGSRQATVWDIFRFFQGKFTQALRDWKIAPEREIKRMEEMKDKRRIFDQLPFSKVKAYCLDECDYLAKLGRALLEAHDNAGLPLKDFFGAGSTASAFLKKIDIKSYLADLPEEMRDAVASAFFGGRFEISHAGPVYGKVFNYDISSAYPYQATFLPCLVHGRWRRITPRSNTFEKSIRESRLALIRWHLPYKERLAWGPWPVRTETGTIAFPSGGAGGWVWKEEFLAGRELCPWAEAKEAWVYEQHCKHRPFKDIPHYYLERLKLGEDARGIVIKLGLNSIYGKLAQSIGLAPPYQSWIWAGNITSNTRAQLLRGLLKVKNPWDILMMATDGIFSRVPIEFDKPKDTGTGDTKKPLGAWTMKILEKGIFCVRPGIYFPLNPTKKQIKDVRARGLGRKVLYEEWRGIVQAWRRGAGKIEIGGAVRFVGCKSALTRNEKTKVVKRSKDYGEWIPHPIQCSFSPEPKRERYIKAGEGDKLGTWGYFDFISAPYKKATESPEALMLELFAQIMEDQPTSDLLMEA